MGRKKSPLLLFMTQMLTGKPMEGLLKKRDKKPKIPAMNKDERARRKGMKVFHYKDKDGFIKTIYAINEKNAKKKAKKSGLEV